jgi:phenylpropionate dioxygenase-like ring-hydroxylating dioxygenase large terminal subunit
MKAEDYSQGDAFQTERRTIFTTEWLPACAEGQLAEPGDFLASTVGGWSIVATRDKQANLRVLRNLCRHQNMPVVSAPSGKAETFRCRFHGWTYDLSGKLVGAPPPVAPADPQSPAVNLIPLAVTQQNGLVSFHLDGSTPPPALALSLPAYSGTLSTDITCNWKVLVEHLLDQHRTTPDFVWTWPLLAVRRVGPTVIVEQIAPHTFLRTRLLTHVFGGSAQDHKPSTELIKQACEGLQASRAAGVMAKDGNELVATFHRRLDVIYAEARSTT